MKQWWNGLGQQDRADVVRAMQIAGGALAVAVLVLGVFPALATVVGNLVAS